MSLEAQVLLCPLCVGQKSLRQEPENLKLEAQPPGVPGQLPGGGSTAGRGSKDLAPGGDTRPRPSPDMAHSGGARASHQPRPRGAGIGGEGELCAAWRSPAHGRGLPGHPAGNASPLRLPGPLGRARSPRLLQAKGLVSRSHPAADTTFPSGLGGPVSARWGWLSSVHTLRCGPAGPHSCSGAKTRLRCRKYSVVTVRAQGGPGENGLILHRQSGRTAWRQWP